MSRALLICGAMIVNGAHAEVTLDGTRGTSGAITPSNGAYAITEAQGETVGSNLFHSFTTFNVGAAETATFSGSAGIHNVVARVTGGSASTVDGKIVNEISGANLWLMNPNGVMFGKNASLDLKGSFYVSTADYLQFADGTRYYADAQNDFPIRTDAILTTANPSAFGFLVDAPANPPQIDISNASLQVANLHDFSIVGRDIVLKDSLLRAPGGDISVVSISSSGTVTYSDGRADVSANTLGRLVVDKTSFVVSGDGVGKLQIVGGDVQIDTHESDLSAGVTLLKASFFDDAKLLEKPCELAAFQGAGELNITMSEDDETFGLQSADNDAERLKQQLECK